MLHEKGWVPLIEICSLIKRQVESDNPPPQPDFQEIDPSNPEYRDSPNVGKDEWQKKARDMAQSNTHGIDSGHMGNLRPIG